VLTSGLVLALAVACVAAARAHRLLHILQQEHYENARLRVWLRRDVKRYELASGVAALGAGAAVQAAGEVGNAVATVPAAIAVIVAAGYLRATWRRPQVKALVFTARAKRIYGVSIAAPAAVALVLAAAVPAAAPAAEGLLAAVVIWGGGWLVGGANAALQPYQRLENRRYVAAARSRLERVAPVVVGVSGSFGKTTTKACVAAAVEPLGPALPTPASFNSYLGVVRAINEGLEPDHQTFVAELGAYRIGDIAELCALVKPTIGVLVSLGPAHLERFGSMDAIEQAEGEVADALPADGLFVTSADDERCVRVADTRARCACLLFSVAGHPRADLWADDIEVSAGGTSFTLRRRGTEASVRFRTRLLGEHNVANVLAAVAVAGHLGLADQIIARTMRRVVPPKHRLEPIVNEAAGVIVIDDSYNANPVGAAAALDVLAAHAAGRRILVTPGMVELGSRAAEENRLLGVKAAAVCDLCVLSGPLAPDIESGLRDAGFPSAQIHVVSDGPAAHAVVAQLSRRGDVFLFENDLPDVYG